MLWDPLIPLDFGAFTIIGAHYNIAVGTIVRYLHNRPDLEPLVQSLLKLETIGLFLLSERGHGLDAFNLETTATKHGNEFILHTPREAAAKYVLLSFYFDVAVVLRSVLLSFCCAEPSFSLRRSDSCPPPRQASASGKWPSSPRV